MARTSTSSSRLHNLGWTLAGAGLVWALVGGAFGVSALADLAPSEADAAPAAASSRAIGIPATIVPQEPTVAEPTKISAREAFAMMQQDTDLVILDVRTDQEYASGHVPEAKLLPYDLITAQNAAAVIPSADTPVLVYCRSGKRAEVAAQALVDLGYTNVYDFGGILDWPYDVVPGSATDAATTRTAPRAAVNPPSYQWMSNLSLH